LTNVIKLQKHVTAGISLGWKFW